MVQETELGGDGRIATTPEAWAWALLWICAKYHSPSGNVAINGYLVLQAGGPKMTRHEANHIIPLCSSRFGDVPTLSNWPSQFLVYRNFLWQISCESCLRKSICLFLVNSGWWLAYDAGDLSLPQPFCLTLFKLLTLYNGSLSVKQG